MLLNIELLNSAAPFEVAGYRVEPSRLTVACASDEVRLESKTMQVLVYLTEQAGRVVSRRELEEHLWSGRIVTEDSVTSAISKLRRAFGDDARHPRVIETVPKNGYRLIAPVMPIREGHETGAVLPVTGLPIGEDRWRPGVSLAAGGSILLLILLVAAWLVFGRGGSPPGQPSFSDKPTLAVLPFKNLGAIPEQDYFANGMTADLITGLSKVEGLLVIAPGSVFAYKDSEDRLRRISAALDVGHVVVGSVQRSGNHLRINPDYMRARMWLAAAFAFVGSSDSAEWEVTELLALSPDLTIGRLEFAFPFRDPRELDVLLDGLRMAGLPE